MVSESPRPLVGYLLFPSEGGEDDLARCCDLLGERAPVVEPDPPRGAWFLLRAGKRARPPEAAGTALLAFLDQHGCPGARLAFAPTPGVARLATIVGAGPLTILPPSGVPGFLAPLSVEAPELDPELADRLHLIGLHTLGDIAALPRGNLGDYLGPLGVAIEALARGEDDRPLATRRPSLTLAAERELDWPLTDRTQLAELVRWLATPLAHQLRHEGLGATRAMIALRIGTRLLRATAHLPTPMAEAAALVAALLAAAAARLDLLAARGLDDDAGECSGGITAVAVKLTAPRPLPTRQLSFYDVPQGRAARLRDGIDRARRRGEGLVGYLRPVEVDHRRPARRYALDPEALPPEAAS